MRYPISPAIRRAIDETVENASSSLAVYPAAVAIQRLHSADNMALEDIVAGLIDRAKFRSLCLELNMSDIIAGQPIEVLIEDARSEIA